MLYVKERCVGTWKSRLINGATARLGDGNLHLALGLVSVAAIDWDNI